MNFFKRGTNRASGGRSAGPSIPAAITLILVLYLSAVLATFALGGLTGVSRYLFLRFDIAGLALAFVLYLVAYLLALTSSGRVSKPARHFDLSKVRIGWIALATFGVSVLGTHLVYGGYALSMDEWMPRLQADIFLDGSSTAMIGSEWKAYGPALFHSFATIDTETGRIASSYRPGMAALTAVFDLVGAGLYVSAVLNAASVLLISRVARLLWPDADPSLAVIAALLLAMSQQALAASMTSYAMTAHQFFALLWLYLFLQDKHVLHAAAACVGVLAASLHQVHVHLFFALPFVATLAFRREFRPLIVYAVIYLVGHWLVIAWDQVLIDEVAARDPASARTFLDNLALFLAWPTLSDLASSWTNLVRLLVWQNLAVLPALWFLLKRSAGHAWVWTCLLSLGLSLMPHIFVVPDQGHGWGYRYLHLHLGLLALLAALGWSTLADPESAMVRRWLAILVALTPLMIGLRAVQIESFVTPYRLATQAAHGTDADVVIIDSYRVMVGNDIPRNLPPEMSRPVVMSLHALSVEEITALCLRYRVVALSSAELAPLGLQTYDADVLPNRAEFVQKWNRVNSVRCRHG